MDFVFVLVACSCVVWLFLYFVISVCMLVRGARLQAMTFVQPMSLAKNDN